jgi:hypothetical protein
MAWGRATMHALRRFTMSLNYVNDLADAGNDAVQAAYGPQKYDRRLAQTDLGPRQRLPAQPEHPALAPFTHIAFQVLGEGEIDLVLVSEWFGPSRGQVGQPVVRSSPRDRSRRTPTRSSGSPRGCSPAPMGRLPARADVRRERSRSCVTDGVRSHRARGLLPQPLMRTWPPRPP